MTDTQRARLREFAGYIPEPKRSDFYLVIKQLTKVSILDPSAVEIVPCEERVVKQATIDTSGVPTCFTETRLREKDVIEIGGYIFPFETLKQVWYAYHQVYHMGSRRAEDKGLFWRICEPLKISKEASRAAQRAYAPWAGQFAESKDRMAEIERVLRRKQEGSAMVKKMRGLK